MSLLRAEDYLYNNPKHSNNLYWSELLKTIDQFDQLIELQRKQIWGFLKEQLQNKLDLIKNFQNYKDSLKFLGDFNKKQIIILDHEKSTYFFQGYHEHIIQIIQKCLKNPKNLANVLSKYTASKKHKFQDFCQNIPFIIYPYYIPSFANRPSNCLKFIQTIIYNWPYSIDLSRPKFHSSIDEIICGFLKVPTITCYVQKIAFKFLKQISNCRMELFAFDEDAIKNQLDIKKHATISYNQPEKQSVRSRLKAFFFKRGKDDSGLTSNTSSIAVNQNIQRMSDQKSQSQYGNLPQMMKKRQTSFIDLIKNTVQHILNEEPPFLLKKMLQYFDKKIEIQYMKAGKTKQNQLKHYCYFMMTNLIFAELHNKFTISHEDTGMTNADLQNISEIIKILSLIFQGQQPQTKRYKNIVHGLGNYKQQVTKFYQNIIFEKDEEIEYEQMRQMLVNYYQGNIGFSFNDLAVLIQVVKSSIKQNQFDLAASTLQLKFLKLENVEQLFSEGKRIKFKNVYYNPENMLFLHDWNNPNVKELIDFYTGAQQPLEYLPMLKQIFFFSSNLQVSQSLQITQDLKLIKKMPLKDIKSYLIKIANKFNHLHIKKSFSIQSTFRDTLKGTLRNSLKRKQFLLYYRGEILYKIQQQNNLMNYFMNQLKSQEFYQKISQSFIENTKIKVYMNIQNNLLKIHKDPKDLKGLQISNLMISTSDSKSSKSNEDYLLRNSFKSFESIKQLLRSISKNQITKAALLSGRKAEQFNSMFCKCCQYVLSYLQSYLKKKDILQNINKEKLQELIIKKMQNQIYFRYLGEKLIDEDQKLVKMAQLIDKQKFHKAQIQNLGVQTEFLLFEGRQNLFVLTSEKNVSEKLVHLQNLFKIIFTIVGFTMAKSKISSDIITPIIQYTVLSCPQFGHFRCLFALQCLKYTKNPQVQFQITNYRSSLMYISENMIHDFHLNTCYSIKN